MRFQPDTPQGLYPVSSRRHRYSSHRNADVPRSSVFPYLPDVPSRPPACTVSPTLDGNLAEVHMVHCGLCCRPSGHIPPSATCRRAYSCSWFTATTLPPFSVASTARCLCNVYPRPFVHLLLCRPTGLCRVPNGEVMNRNSSRSTGNESPCSAPSRSGADCVLPELPALCRHLLHLTCLCLLQPFCSQ